MSDRAREPSRLLAQAARYLVGCVLSFALWGLWLGLVLLAAAQVYVASRNELAAPDFILRGLEARLAETGLHAKFENARFDPTGRIFLQSPRIFLPGYEDPVASARAAYIEINPWALAIGRFDVSEVRLLEATVSVPAMLSPSGRAEPLVHDLDALIAPGSSEIAIRHVTARLGGLVVSIHGTVPVRRGRGRAPADIGSVVQARFRDFCRLAIAASRQLEALEEPALDLQLAATSTRGIVVSAELTAQGLKLTSPLAVDVGPFRATTRLPVLGDAPTLSELRLDADSVHLPGGVEIRRLNSLFRARLQLPERRIDPVDLVVAAQEIASPEAAVEHVSATVLPLPLPRLQADLVARVLGAPLAVSGRVDVGTRTADVRFAGDVSPSIIDVIAERTRVPLRGFFSFQAFSLDGGQAQLGPDWKFQRASAQVKLRGIDAHGVPMDEGHALIELDPQRLYAPEAYVRLGQNYAAGSYEQNLATREFRFLLNGRLRPMVLADWFRDWWPNFFQRFEFPASPPVASVDVRGVWREGRQTSVFIFADADAPVIEGQPLRHVLTRLFVRPGFYDAIEMKGIGPEGGNADGTFAVSADVGTGDWKSIDVDATSSVGIGVAAKLLGDIGDSVLSPFAVAQPPAVKVKVHLDGPAVEGVRHRSVDVDARSSGPFRFYDFPLQDVSFHAALRDADLAVSNVAGRFAGGAVRGNARVTGIETERRLAFDIVLTDAALGQTVQDVQGFVALRKGKPAPAPGKFVQQKNNVRLDLTATGQGVYGDPLSFHGGGNGVLRGAEIGEVPLLGMLSDLLKFTALRFTTANATFKINGAKLEFPEVALRGANSAIDAHGEYALDRQQLDFRAKVFPFQESGSVIKSVVGAVLSPISNVLEVKLTGSLADPQWAFVIGPTNILRSLGSDQSQTAKAGVGAGDKSGDKPAAAAHPATPAPADPAPKPD